MHAPKVITIDFETEAIHQRPNYPPKPVGVAIKWPQERSGRYYAWGHPTENNCTWRQGLAALDKAYTSGLPLLFHNSKFDVDVAEIHCGMSRLDWRQIHDTLFLLFLNDPHAKTLSLKPASAEILGLPPDEQDAVVDWITNNISTGNRRVVKSKAGAFIGCAPGKLVGRYAVGDVNRTTKLFKKLWPSIQNRGMLTAYDIERELMPLLLDNERQGMRVDLHRLSEEYELYNNAFMRATQWIYKSIGTEINLNSGAQLITALVKSGKVDQGKLRYTDKGNLKSDSESLACVVTDTQLLAMLAYRSKLKTCLTTFMGPWLTMATNSKGLIHTSWNQVRGPKFGTRTGRFSSTPNFQNIPKTFDPMWKHEESDVKKKRKLVKCPIPNLPSLPHMRGYIIPWAPSHVLIDRDYSQQELRILAHFGDGVLAQKYRNNPWLDVHRHAQEMINSLLGTDYDRKPIKNTAFGLLYGMGVAKTAEKSKCSYAEAKSIRQAYLAGFPELEDMQRDMKQRAHLGEPIYTLSGREYFCEDPRIIDGQLRHFDYKMINCLIQGSAADHIKRAIIAYHKVKKKGERFFLSVHDEILVSTPKSTMHTSMTRLKKAMEQAVRFEVPMLSEGSVGSRWDNLKDYDKKGKKVYASKAATSD